MANVYARVTKISNAKGRSNYIQDKEKQEEILVHEVSMKHDWDFYSKYERAKSNSDKSNNEAREFVIALPNELADNKMQLKEVCDDLATRLVGQHHDYEYAVHWNQPRTNLHVHLLFSERAVVQEVMPKIYKKDQWRDKETNQLAKANSENAYLYAKKGDVQKDKEGNIKYDSEPLTIKDTKFISKKFNNLDMPKLIQETLEHHGFNLEIQNFETPYLSQKKLFKGASQDYLEQAKTWNDTVKDYNRSVETHIELEPSMEQTYVSVKKDLNKRVKETNREVKKITPQAIQLVVEMTTWVKDFINEYKEKLKHMLQHESALKEKWENTKERMSQLFRGKEYLESVQDSLERENKTLNVYVNEVSKAHDNNIKTVNNIQRQIERSHSHGRSR